MFILDKNLAMGEFKIGVGTSNSYPSNRFSVRRVDTVAESDNFNVYDGGGYDETGPWFVTSTGSGLTWNRMADGVLVERSTMGFKVSPSSIFLLNDTYASEPVSEVPTVSTTGYPYKNLELPGYYSKSEFDGAQYDVKVMLLGKTKDEFNTSDHYKYINATGLSDWVLNKMITSNYLRAGYSTSYVNIVGTDGNWSEKTTNQTGSTVSFRLVAYPTGTVPAITPIEHDFGVITEPESKVFQVVGTPTLTISYDGEAEESLVSGTGNFTVDLTSKWSSLSYGKHTIVVRAKQNGYQCGARITFTKSSSVVSVTTNPHSSVERPVMCKLVDDVTDGGGVVSRSVTNNANDENPVWEPYEGDMHVFSNDTKTAATWGVAARVGVDNSEGSANAEIRNAIALGVLYDRGGGTL